MQPLVLPAFQARRPSPNHFEQNMKCISKSFESSFNAFKFTTNRCIYILMPMLNITVLSHCKVAVRIFLNNYRGLISLIRYLKLMQSLTVVGK